MKIAINPNHRETIEIDGATFTVRPLTGGDMLECYAIGESSKAMMEMIDRGVVDWAGVTGHDGFEIKRKSGVRILPRSALELLLSKIHDLSTVSEETAKN
jgi:hypothetical protein